MAIRWYVVFVLALILITQATASRDIPTTTEADVAAKTNTVNVGPTDKNTVAPGGKGTVKDKKCGMLFSGIGGWGAMGGFIPLRANAVNGGAAGAAVAGGAHP